MPRATKAQRSPLGLLVLWSLVQQPLHVYGLQKLLEHQGKNRVVNVRSRANLYQAIERLLRLGLVEVRETVRVEGRPDRTVYAITDAGREAATEWLRDMLRTTPDSFPEFVAAVSVLFALHPDDARRQLELRAERLAAELADAEAQLAGHPDVPRLFLLEEEYRRAVLAAELAWVRGVADDIGAGRLTWSEEWLRAVAAASAPTDQHEEHERRDAP